MGFPGIKSWHSFCDGASAQLGGEKLLVCLNAKKISFSKLLVSVRYLLDKTSVLILQFPGSCCNFTYRGFPLVLSLTLIFLWLIFQRPNSGS